MTETVRSLKKKELFNFHQREMTVTEYERKFIKLVFTRDIQLSKAMKVNMFKNHLHPRINSMITVQRLKTLRDMVDATRIAEREK